MPTKEEKIKEMYKIFLANTGTSSHGWDIKNWDKLMEDIVIWHESELSKQREEIDENTSDGYHTFKELYEFRLLYNASLFNEWALSNKYDVHKSKKHSDGLECFGGGWFIVMAELPTGQISNHYELKDWDLFQIPEKEIANEFDGHSSQDVALRLKDFLQPKGGEDESN